MCRGPTGCWRPRPHAARSEALATQPILAHDGGMLLLAIFQGLSAGLRLQESLLYRSPYRNAEEAIRGDAKRIYGDIEVCMERLYE